LNRRWKFQKSTKTLDDIINFQRYQFIKIGLGYDVVVASLSTPSIATTREVAFVASGVQIVFTEEKPTIDCSKQIDEFHIPHMSEFEHTVTNDIVVDMLDCYTLVRELNPHPSSFDHPTQKHKPYHHPHHKIRRNGNHAFRYFQKRRERHNCEPMSTTKIDCCNAPIPGREGATLRNNNLILNSIYKTCI
jgi:hypothetical protein